jgi:hypothetical protein
METGEGSAVQLSTTYWKYFQSTTRCTVRRGILIAQIIFA